MHFGNQSVRVSAFAMIIGALPGVSIFALANLVQDDPPAPYVVSNSDDMNGDGQSDTVIADPSGGGSFQSGTIDVHSGENGSMLTTISGKESGDEFGFSASTGCDLNDDSFRDLIAGAPKESDEEGRAYIFYGPFRDENSLTAEDADVTLQSPDSDTHWFGQHVECIPDINNDGFADVLVEAVASNETGAEWVRTYIFSGQDSTLLQTLNATKDLGGPVPLPPCFGDIAPAANWMVASM